MTFLCFTLAPFTPSTFQSPLYPQLMPEDCLVRQSGRRTRDLEKRILETASRVGTRYMSLLRYRTRFPTCASNVGGQNPGLYLKPLKSMGASVRAFVYSALTTVGFWKYVYTVETIDWVR